MDEIDQSQIGHLGPESPSSIKPPRKVSWLLLLWPFAGLITTAVAVFSCTPLDDTLIWWISAIPILICYGLINISWRKAQAGEGVPSYFPRTVWLAAGCLAVPTVLFANGALDRSPVEQHRQTIIRTIIDHGRTGDIFYYVECSSWRGRSREKLMVSPRVYTESRPGDSFVVETHSGAFGITMLVSAHRLE